jgi:hypothetical protein
LLEIGEEMAKWLEIEFMQKWVLIIVDDLGLVGNSQYALEPIIN